MPDKGEKEAGRGVGSKWFGKFARQELDSQWQPIPSLRWTVIFYLVVAAVFIALGSVFLEQTLNVVQIRERYDDKGEFRELDDQGRFEKLVELNAQGDESLADRRLEFTVQITKDMDPPVFVFYELGDFFQNHKRYVRSLSSQQLGGESAGNPTECEPKKDIQVDGEDKLIVPCGLIASSFFNDSFSITMKEQPLTINDKGISWDWDREYLYGDEQPENFNENGTNRLGGTFSGPINQNERFMVWMRVAASPTARKLYGKIEQKISKGTDLQFSVVNNYNTYKFGGEKYVVLSTSNWTGGRNMFMGVLYIVVGCLSALAAFSFFWRDRITQRTQGDLSCLSWVKKDN